MCHAECASDVKAVKDYVDSNIASASNLYRSQVFHTAAAARYEHLKSDPAFAGENGDATRALPQGFPKFAALKPVKLTISEHLPSDLLATQEAAIATAARAYEKEALTQLAAAKKKAAEELEKLCEAHPETFESGIGSFFTENVSDAEKTRLTESAKLDYFTACASAKTAFEIETKEKDRKKEANAQKFAEQKLLALQKKDHQTVGHAVDVKIALNNAELQKKNPESIKTLPVLVKTPALLSENSRISSLNQKGAAVDQSRGTSKTNLASKKKTSKKEKRRQKQQQQQQQQPPTKGKKKKDSKAKPKPKPGTTKKGGGGGKAAASASAAAPTVSGRKRKRSGERRDA